MKLGIANTIKNLQSKRKSREKEHREQDFVKSEKD